MASLVNFENDPSTDTMLRGLEAGVRARHAREQVAVDEATRQGINDMMAAGGSAGYQAPEMAPQGIDLSAVAPAPAMAPAAPVVPPRQMAAGDAMPASVQFSMPDNAMEPGFDPSTTAGDVPMVPQSTSQRTLEFRPPGGITPGNPADWTVARPSASGAFQGLSPSDLQTPLSDRNNNPGNLVYAGQPGAVRGQGGFAAFPTRDAGLAAADANLAAYGSLHGINTIAGVIGRWSPANAPGNSPESTAAYIQRVSAATGIGPNQPINLADPNVRQALLRVMYAHEGGAGSIASGGAPVAPMAPGASFMASYGLGGANPNFNARYDPILRRLAAAPGGGEAALKILAGQSRYDMQNNRRTDNFNRLAMQAFARGDVQTGQYFAQQGGMRVPSWLGQDMAQTRRAGVGALVAQRLYGDANPAQAQRFVQAYLQSGDAGQAMQAAGAPQGRVMSVQQVYDEENNVLQYVGIQRDGTTFPLRNPDGTPLQGNLRPANQIVQTPNGPVVVQRNAPGAPAAPVMAPDGSRVGPNTKPSAIEQKRDMLIQAGMSPQDAALMAAGGKPAGGIKPETIISYRRSRLNALANDIKTRPADRQALVDRETAELFGPEWRTRIQGGAAAAPAGRGGAGLPQAPQDTGGAPAQQPVPPRPSGVPAGSEWSPSRRMWRTPDGKLLGETGIPAAGA